MRGDKKTRMRCNKIWYKICEYRWMMRCDERWSERWEKRWDEIRDEIKDELRDARWYQRWDERWDKRWDGRWDEKVDEGWLMAQVAILKDFTFPPTRGVFNSKCLSIMTNRWNNDMIWKKNIFCTRWVLKYGEKTQKYTQKQWKVAFFHVLGQKWTFFKFFRTDFFMEY